MAVTAVHFSAPRATEDERRLAREHGLRIVAPVDLPGEPIDPLCSHSVKSHTLHENSPQCPMDHKEAKEEGLCETPIYVEFDEDDPRDPFNFSRPKKWFITVVGTTYTLFVSASGVSYTSGYPSMMRDLGCTELQATAGLTTYLLGFAVAPLVLSSLSEEVGRRPMYISTCALFCLFFIPTAVAKNIATVIISRLIQGCAASTGATMVGGTIADVWRTSERGFPMSIYTVFALVSNGMSPVISGWIEQNRHLEWRWIQWIALILSSAYFVILYFTMVETRGSILLIQLVKNLRKTSGVNRFRAPIEDTRASLKDLMIISCTRPIWLLISEPIVLSFSVWLGFVWGVLFGLIDTLTLVMSTIYPKFNTGELGTAYLSIAVGSVLGFLGTFWQERVYRAKVATLGPEARLYAGCAGGLLVSIGSFIYAWTTLPGRGIPWIAPLIGVSIMMTGMFQVYLSVFNYLADAYLAYASSALSGQSFLRNVMAAVFPLFTRQMYRNLSFHWASTIFALISVLLLFVPFVLISRGSEIRARSRFAKQLANANIDAKH